MKDMNTGAATRVAPKANRYVILRSSAGSTEIIELAGNSQFCEVSATTFDFDLEAKDGDEKSYRVEVKFLPIIDSQTRKKDIKMSFWKNHGMNMSRALRECELRVRQMIGQGRQTAVITSTEMWIGGVNVHVMYSISKR